MKYNQDFFDAWRRGKRMQKFLQIPGNIAPSNYRNYNDISVWWWRQWSDERPPRLRRCYRNSRKWMGLNQIGETLEEGNWKMVIYANFLGNTMIFWDLLQGSTVESRTESEPNLEHSKIWRESKQCWKTAVGSLKKETPTKHCLVKLRIFINFYQEIFRSFSSDIDFWKAFKNKKQFSSTRESAFLSLSGSLFEFTPWPPSSLA